jgi:hypothetical protein
MSNVQSEVAGDSELAEGDELVSAPKGIRRGTRAQALEIIFRTALEEDEGFRHGVLGKPRQGKTYHLQEVVERAIALRIADWAIIHDVKKPEAQYQGLVRSSVEDFRLRPPRGGDGRVIVIHPSEWEQKETLENVALKGLDLGRHKEANLIVADELYQGLKSRMTWAGPSFGEILREGSSKRISSAWTTQIPQALPTDALDLTETMALFAMLGRSRRYAVDAYELPHEGSVALKSLRRGEFLMVTGDDWDRTVYGPK